MTGEYERFMYVATIQSCGEQDCCFLRGGHFHTAASSGEQFLLSDFTIPAVDPGVAFFKDVWHIEHDQFFDDIFSVG